MWKLAGDTPLSKQRNVERLTQSFLSLRGRIPGLLHLEIGVDSSGVDYACDVVLYSEFESQSALDDYAIHPEHLRVKQKLATCASPATKWTTPWSHPMCAQRN